jgi:hypothetical protein
MRKKDAVLFCAGSEIILLSISSNYLSYALLIVAVVLAARLLRAHYQSKTSNFNALYITKQVSYIFVFLLYFLIDHLYYGSYVYASKLYLVNLFLLLLLLLMIQIFFYQRKVIRQNLINKFIIYFLLIGATLLSLPIYFNWRYPIIESDNTLVNYENTTKGPTNLLELGLNTDISLGGSNDCGTTLIFW